MMKELVDITVTPEQQVVMLFSDDFERSTPEEREILLKSLVTVSLNRLGKDYELAGIQTRAPKSKMAAHDNIVLNIKMLGNSNGEYDTLVYFGGKFNYGIPLKQALQYVMQIVYSVGNDAVDFS